MSNLQNKMYEYEVAPPAIVWEQISRELNHPSIQSTKSNTGNIRNFSLNLVAAAILLLIVSTIFFDIQPGTSSSASAVSETGYRLAPESEDVLLTEKSTPASASKPYITLEGPHGKVKVSRKVAAIFVAPEPSSKAQWIKKLDRWKNIMMTASNTDFMDVIPLTQASETEN